MKNRIRIFLVGAALISLLLLLATGDGLAKGSKNAAFFSGTSNASFAVFADWGEYTCPGGEASGLPYGPPAAGGTLAPCSPGSNFHMRDREMVFDILVSDPAVTAPLVEGVSTLLVNWNWRYESAEETAYYSGPMWGTFTLVLSEDDGATWEGTMTGDWDGATGLGTWSFIGHGNGGDIDGMQLKMDFVGGVFGGPIQGRILSPGSAQE